MSLKGEDGEYYGGPMYYIKKGLGGGIGKFLGGFYAVALFVLVVTDACFVQTNTLATGSAPAHSQREGGTHEAAHGGGRGKGVLEDHAKGGRNVVLVVTDACFVQTNTLATSAQDVFHIPLIVSGVVLVALSIFVIMRGGIKKMEGVQGAVAGGGGVILLAEQFPHGLFPDGLDAGELEEAGAGGQVETGGCASWATLSTGIPG